MNLSGIGMTSMRTRQRLISRLLEQGISDFDVLETMLFMIVELDVKMSPCLLVTIRPCRSLILSRE